MQIQYMYPQRHSLQSSPIPSYVYTYRIKHVYYFVMRSCYPIVRVPKVVFDKVFQSELQVLYLHFDLIHADKFAD